MERDLRPEVELELGIRQGLYSVQNICDTGECDGSAEGDAGVVGAKYG